jgi:hypothetical protein
VPEVGAERWPGGERRKARAASEHRKVTRYQRLDLLEVVLRVRAQWLRRDWSVEGTPGLGNRGVGASHVKGASAADVR